jgi:hypothetical protein
MGEIVDLESYRKQRQRRASDSAASESAAAGRRRERSGAEPKDHRSRPAIESIESGGAEADRAAKIDRDDPKSD